MVESNNYFVNEGLPEFAGEDPFRWIIIVERFFQEQKIHSSDKVQWAFMRMEGVAMSWFQDWCQEDLDADWQTFAIALFRRFGSQRQYSMEKTMLEKLATDLEKRKATEIRKIHGLDVTKGDEESKDSDEGADSESDNIIDAAAESVEADNKEVSVKKNPTAVTDPLPPPPNTDPLTTAPPRPEAPAEDPLATIMSLLLEETMNKSPWEQESGDPTLLKEEERVITMQEVRRRNKPSPLPKPPDSLAANPPRRVPQPKPWKPLDPRLLSRPPSPYDSTMFQDLTLQPFDKRSLGTKEREANQPSVSFSFFSANSSPLDQHQSINDYYAPLNVQRSRCMILSTCAAPFASVTPIQRPFSPSDAYLDGAGQSGPLTTNTIRVNHLQPAVGLHVSFSGSFVSQHMGRHLYMSSKLLCPVIVEPELVSCLCLAPTSACTYEFFLSGCSDTIAGSSVLGTQKMWVALFYSCNRLGEYTWYRTKSKRGKSHPLHISNYSYVVICGTKATHKPSFEGIGINLVLYWVLIRQWDPGKSNIPLIVTFATNYVSKVLNFLHASFQVFSVQVFVGLTTGSNREGIQVTECDLDLHVGIILIFAIGLAWHDNVGKQSILAIDAFSSLPSYINTAIDALALLGIYFHGCFLIFEGEFNFLSTVMESSEVFDLLSCIKKTAIPTGGNRNMKKEMALVLLSDLQTKIFPMNDMSYYIGPVDGYYIDELGVYCFEVGIAEQHAVMFAAGLACKVIKPFGAIYSSFMQRAYDLGVHDVDLQKLFVRIAMGRAGSVGADGPTHSRLNRSVTHSLAKSHEVIIVEEATWGEAVNVRSQFLGLRLEDKSLFQEGGNVRTHVGPNMRLAHQLPSPMCGKVMLGKYRKGEEQIENADVARREGACVLSDGFCYVGDVRERSGYHWELFSYDLRVWAEGEMSLL